MSSVTSCVGGGWFLCFTCLHVSYSTVTFITRVWQTASCATCHVLLLVEGFWRNTVHIYHTKLCCGLWSLVRNLILSYEMPFKRTSVAASLANHSHGAECGD
jgi:hypothetical protein